MTIRAIDVVIVGLLIGLLSVRAAEQILQNPEPSTLVIGDSIAVAGWAHALENAGTIPENGGSSSHTVAKLLEWLEDKPHYELILWNNGLHDAMRGEDGQCAVGLDEYAANLRIIAPILKLRADRVVFVASILPQIDGTLGVHAEDVVERNRVARRIMAERDIPVIALDEFTAGFGFTAYDGLHFGADAARAQAAFIQDQLASL